MPYAVYNYIDTESVISCSCRSTCKADANDMWAKWHIQKTRKSERNKKPGENGTEKPNERTLFASRLLPHLLQFHMLCVVFCVSESSFLSRTSEFPEQHHNKTEKHIHPQQQQQQNRDTLSLYVHCTHIEYVRQRISSENPR